MVRWLLRQPFSGAGGGGFSGWQRWTTVDLQWTTVGDGLTCNTGKQATDRQLAFVSIGRQGNRPSIPPADSQVRPKTPLVNSSSNKTYQKANSKVQEWQGEGLLFEAYTTRRN